jgi:hypothetical protein
MLLDKSGDSAGDLPCVDSWSIKDLLAVRAWWSERVVDWIEVGRVGGTLVLPAPGYKWTETPRLNAGIVSVCGPEPYESIRGRLRAAFQRVVAQIDSLTDRELFEVRVFPWAGKWPLSRWLSVNTARQYSTATALIRRAMLQARQP